MMRVVMLLVKSGDGRGRVDQSATDLQRSSVEPVVRRGSSDRERWNRPPKPLRIKKKVACKDIVESRRLRGPAQLDLPVWVSEVDRLSYLQMPPPRDEIHRPSSRRLFQLLLNILHQLLECLAKPLQSIGHFDPDDHLRASPRLRALIQLFLPLSCRNVQHGNHTQLREKLAENDNLLISGYLQQFNLRQTALSEHWRP